MIARAPGSTLQAPGGDGESLVLGLKPEAWRLEAAS